LALIGLAALWFPISLDQYDPYGFPVRCGNGFSSNLTQAAQVDAGDLVTKCGTALLTRRIWAIPALAIGWLLVTGFLFAWVRGARSETEPETAESKNTSPA